MRPLTRLGGVRRCRLLSNLPFAPDFVPQAPVFDVVRLVAASVLSAQVSVVAMRGVCQNSIYLYVHGTHVSPVPLQYSIQCRASAKVPVPMFRIM